MHEGTLVADRYEVRGRLACGGMADVLVAHDHRLQRDVALKVARSSTTSTDRARFDAEIRLLASLQHPHLVRMFDAGVHEGDAFLVLELADGPTLGAMLCAGPVPEDQLRSLGRDLAGALAHVHERGILHRDVKPANVLTAADGRWLLADFGIARLHDATGLTATGTAIGTPAYLAPEQLTGEPVTPAADVYALGLTLIEAATGRPVFAGSGTEAAMARLARDPDVSAAPAAWQGLLATMTARDPADRPSAAAVARQLADDVVAAPTEPLLVPAAVTATATLPIVEPAWDGGPGGADRPPRARPWLGVAAALFVLSLLVAGAWAWLGAPDDGEVAAASPASTLAPVATTVAPTALTTVAPVTTVPAATPTTTPAADPCAALQAQLDQVEAQRDAARGQPRAHGHDAPDVKRQLDEQRRALTRQLHEQHC